jgi:hypothetical protein
VSLGLPVPLFPSDLVWSIVFVIRLLSIHVTCPAHFSLLIFMYLTTSGAYNLYNSKLYLLLHCPLSCTAPKILLRIFLSSSPSAFVSVQVSEAHVPTGLIQRQLCFPWNHLWLEMLPKSVKASICRENKFFNLSTHHFTINLGSQVSKAMMKLIRASFYMRRKCA